MFGFRRWAAPSPTVTGQLKSLDSEIYTGGFKAGARLISRGGG
jgi:hypothetical protein